MAAYRSEVRLRQKYASCALPRPVCKIAAAAPGTPADEVPPASGLQLWQRCVCCVEGEEPHICGMPGPHLKLDSCRASIIACM